jgi:hypothetical protein
MPDFEDFGREISKIWPKKYFSDSFLPRGESNEFSLRELRELRELGRDFEIEPPRFNLPFFLGFYGNLYIQKLSFE